MVKDVEDFEKEVISNDKPVVVDFWAQWCGPCRVLAPVLEEVAKGMPEAVFCKVNVDEHGDVASRYGVRGIPTIMVFWKGEPVEGIIVGMKQKEQLQKELKAKLEKCK